MFNYVWIVCACDYLMGYFCILWYTLSFVLFLWIIVCPPAILVTRTHIVCFREKHYQSHYMTKSIISKHEPVNNWHRSWQCRCIPIASHQHHPDCHQQTEVLVQAHATHHIGTAIIHAFYLWYCIYRVRCCKTIVEISVEYLLMPSNRLNLELAKEQRMWRTRKWRMTDPVMKSC